MAKAAKLSFGVVIKSALLAAMAILSVVCVYSLGASSTREKAASKAEQSFFVEEQHGLAIEQCKDLSGDDQVRCVADVVSKTEAVRHDRLDLIAQQTVADWTSWIVLISAAQGAIGLLGLVWVVRTFSQSAIAVKASMDALELSRHAFELENRPWLRITDLNVTKVRARTDRLRVSATLKITHSGRTPAVGVDIICKLYPFSSIETSEQDFANELRKPMSDNTRPINIASDSVAAEDTVGVYWYSEKEKQEKIGEDPTYVLFVAVRYRGLVGDGTLKSTTTALFVSTGDAQRRFSPGMQEIDLQTLVIEKTNRLDEMR